MAWRRLGDKPLSDPMLVSLSTHICVTWPHCLNPHSIVYASCWNAFWKSWKSGTCRFHTHWSSELGCIGLYISLRNRRVTWWHVPLNNKEPTWKYIFTETEISSFWRYFHYWPHQSTSSKAHIQVSPVRKTKWQYFRFSVYLFLNRYFQGSRRICNYDDITSVDPPCFVCCYADQAVEQTFELLVILDALAHKWRHCNEDEYNCHVSETSSYHGYPCPNCKIVQHWAILKGIQRSIGKSL